jgi:hypothetical protein
MALALFCCASFGQGLNFAQYKPADLDKILAQPRPQKGVRMEGPQKLWFEVKMAAFAESCDATFLKKAMVTLGAKKEMVESVPISKCVKVTSAKGVTTPVYIQDRVAKYLPKDASVGSILIIYCDYLYVRADDLGLLLNDYKVLRK